MPRNIDPSVKEEVKQIILNHQGKENAITSREINEHINVDNIGSFPGTRAVIRELVVEDSVPIVAGSQGYFFIESREELNDYVDSLVREGTRNDGTEDSSLKSNG